MQKALGIVCIFGSRSSSGSKCRLIVSVKVAAVAYLCNPLYSVIVK